MGDLYIAEGIWETFFGIFYLVSVLLAWGVGIGTYVLQALGMYTIAKRRGIKKPWLSWIPVGDLWILGSLSDQYRFVVKGKVKNKRKALLILDIVMVVVCVILYVVFGALLVQVLAYDDYMLAADHTLMINMLGTAIGLLIVGLIMLGLSVAVKVIRYMALYDVYTSCEPKNSTLYLVLSIFFEIAVPILLFLYRNKDGGMPPRKQPAVEQAQEVQEEDFA